MRGSNRISTGSMNTLVNLFSYEPCELLSLEDECARVRRKEFEGVAKRGATLMKL